MTETARHRAPGPAGGSGGGGTGPDDSGVSVVRSEERLLPSVAREPVERVVVHRDVVVEQVTQTFDVRREVLRIERLPISRDDLGVTALAPDADRVVEVVLREERPVVTLEVVPVEQVRVSVVPSGSRRTVQVSAEVRTEHVEVDEHPAPS